MMGTFAFSVKKRSPFPLTKTPHHERRQHKDGLSSMLVENKCWVV